MSTLVRDEAGIKKLGIEGSFAWEVDLPEWDEFGVVAQRHYGTLEREHDRGQRDIAALFVAFTHSEAVLKERVQDAANAEPRFDNGRSDLLGHGIGAEFDISAL